MLEEKRSHRLHRFRADRRACIEVEINTPAHRITPRIEMIFIRFPPMAAFLHPRFSVSFIRKATTRPEANVNVPTAVMAQTTPNRSAIIPEMSAPKA